VSEKFDYLLAGLGETPRSLVSECIDYVVNYAVKAETARQIADRRWHMTQEEHEP
jgi:lipase chaperone LimK